MKRVDCVRRVDKDAFGEACDSGCNSKRKSNRPEVLFRLFSRFESARGDVFRAVLKMGEASTRFAALLDGHLEWMRLLNFIRLVCTSIASITTSPNAFEKGARMMRRHVCDCSRGRVGDGCSFANQLVAQTRIHEKILFARTLPPVLSRHLRGWFCKLLAWVVFCVPFIRSTASSPSKHIEC